jgi:hypothetical protein
MRATRNSGITFPPEGLDLEAVKKYQARVCPPDLVPPTPVAVAGKVKRRGVRWRALLPFGKRKRRASSDSDEFKDDLERLFQEGLASGAADISSLFMSQAPTASFLAVHQDALIETVATGTAYDPPTIGGHMEDIDDIEW